MYDTADRHVPSFARRRLHDVRAAAGISSESHPVTGRVHTLGMTTRHRHIATNGELLSDQLLPKMVKNGVSDANPLTPTSALGANRLDQLRGVEL